MLEIQEKAFTIKANILFFTLMTVYGLLKQYLLAVSGDTYAHRVFLICFSIAFLCVLIMTFLLRTSKALALLNPLAIFIGYVSFTIISGGIEYTFVFLAIASIMSSAYFNLKYSAIYFLISHAILIVVILVLNVDLLGYVAQETLYMNWSMLVILNVFLCISISHYASGQEDANKTLTSFETMLATTPNIVVLVDELNRVSFMSNSLKRLAHIDKTSYGIGRPLLDLFPNKDLEDGVAKILNRDDHNSETVETYINNEVRYFQINSVKTSGLIKGRLIDISDITSIMISKNEAERASNAKTDFLSKMSHEIRTPMNAILGMTELVMRETVSERVHKYISTIKSSGDHLLSIINDILDFSKIESGSAEINNSHYLFHSVVQDVVSIIKVQMTNPDVSFVTYMQHDIPNELYGDEVKLRQILINLLKNASKYTRFGHFSLEISSEKIDDSTLMFTMKIKDTGIGIKPEDMPMLFSEFTQFDVIENRHLEGTGLGLALTYNLVNMLGGTIEVKSKHGEGSEFTVTIPQKYISFDSQPLQTESISALIYCKTPLIADYLSRTLEDLSMSHKIVKSEQELKARLSESKWNYIFAEGHIAYVVERVVKSLTLSTKVVMLADSYDGIHESQSEHDFSVLIKPAYFLSVLNIISGADLSYPNYSPKLSLFTAPAANILVVDDVETNLHVVEGLLAQYGVNTTLCTNGKEAIELIRTGDFDLVFMDHMMPNMNGLEAVKIIRQINNGAYTDLPIIALTANAIVGAREMFLENKLNDFISKPIEIEKLNHILAKWLPKDKQI